MIWSLLSCLTLAASTLASPAKRAEGLSVNVTPAAASIDSLESLKFTASITNNRAEAVKILKYATILDGGLPTRSFQVLKGDSHVNFTGIKLSVDLSLAGESAYTTINSGQTLDIVHNIGGLYDFSAAGVGKYSFQPITNFFLANDDAQVKTVKRFVEAEVASSPVEVEITGGLESREVDFLFPRAVPTCSSKSKKTFIASSFSEGQTLAKNAATFLQGTGSGTKKTNSSGLFEAYFGTNSVSKVTSVLDAVAQESSTTRTLSCEDAVNACEEGVIAYTLTKTTNIYFCPIFFQELPVTAICTGTIAKRNYRGGTTLHELTHALSGTDDVQYGCDENQQLSPSQSVINADNYNCFATEVYKSTKCGGSSGGDDNESGFP